MPFAPPLLRGRTTSDGMHLIEVEADGARLTALPAGIARMELWAACIPAGRPDRSLSWDWMRPINLLPFSVLPESVLGLRPRLRGDAIAYRARWMNMGEPVSGWSGMLVLPIPEPMTA